MTTIQDLIDIEEIKQLKARYFRGVDTKDWALIGNTLAPDVVCDYVGATTDPVTGSNALPGTTDRILKGHDDAMEAIRLTERIVTIHHGHMPEITIIDSANATGIWAMVDILRFPDGEPIHEVVGYGYYHETYEKIDGAWKIKTLRLPRLRVDIDYGHGAPV